MFRKKRFAFLPSLRESILKKISISILFHVRGNGSFLGLTVVLKETPPLIIDYSYMISKVFLANISLNQLNEKDFTDRQQYSTGTLENVYFDMSA